MSKSAAIEKLLPINKQQTSSYLAIDNGHSLHPEQKLSKVTRGGVEIPQILDQSVEKCAHWRVPSSKKFFFFFTIAD